MASLGQILSRTFLWCYERGTWQYDIAVAVILIFAAYQFTLGPVSNGNGPAGAEKLGGFGGLLLLVAGVLGFVAAARGDRAAAARAQADPTL